MRALWMIALAAGCSTGTNRPVDLASPGGEPVLAVDVTGMEPQMEIIRRAAAERGWRITCEGRAGEGQVLRLTFPSALAQNELDRYFGPQEHIGSSFSFYSPSHLPPQGAIRRHQQVRPAVQRLAFWQLAQATC